jgi:hypothetical protein
LKLCDPRQPDCGTDLACMSINDRAGAAISGGGLCEGHCNLVDPQRGSAADACGPGLICVWSGQDGSYCSSGEQALRKHGELCETAWHCQPGHTCMNSRTCAKWCVSGDDCPSGFSCDRITPSTVGQDSYGQCKPSCLDATEHVCSLGTQCGCGADRTCDSTVLQDKLVRFCRAIGAVPLYQGCSDILDCGRGAQCADSECQPLCLGDFDCARYSRCEANFFSAVPRSSSGSTCKRPCDPADPYRAHGSYGACAPGTACNVTTDGASDCRPASLRGVAGVSCANATECAAGHTCLTTGYCVALCRNDSDCQTGTCSVFGTSQFAADVEWGYCLTSP